MNFSRFLQRPEVAAQLHHFEQALTARCQPGRHGDLPQWLNTLDTLPKLQADLIELDKDLVLFDSSRETAPELLVALDAGLRALAPWRKGPYQLFDSFIDTEWRSDWKWQRLAPHISDLQGRRVLDVGCGNGYHCWRMLGAGAAQVLGIDPSMRFLVQYLVMQKYANDPRFDFLPIGIEDMPTDWPVFDSVFSMGVLYHRRNPINHLMELFNLLKPGGEVILETLLVDAEYLRASDAGVLRPENRYAMMRNVWSILSTEKILQLLSQAGFSHSRCVDINVTTVAEQRRTEWMQFHSLAEFLDPTDQSKTIEGYPAPKRGIFVAQK